MMRRIQVVWFILGLIFLSTSGSGCMRFHPLPAKVAQQVQPLYDSLQVRYPNSTFLFLALDGVSFDLMDRLQQNGYFASFQPPSRVISTFPSTTIVGFTGLFRPLGCDIPSGYETKFFSLSENRIRGDTYRDYRRLLIPFKQYFNYYRRHLFNKMTMYAFPSRTVNRDIAKIRRNVLNTPNDLIRMAYIGGTDGAAHILGERRVEMLLRTLGNHLESLRVEYEKRFHKHLHIVLFSDHGFHFAMLKSVGLREVETALAKSGYAVAPSLKTPQDVVTVSYGTLSNAVFYTAPTAAEAVAQALSQVEGFDLAFYRKSEHEIGVFSRLGMWAIIREAENGSMFQYDAIVGDPLNYNPRVSRLQSGASSTVSPWLPQRKWWDLTQDHHYPDALSRVYEAFQTLVSNRAQVMVSTLPEFEYGSTEARTGANLHGGLEGTHGGLFKMASSAVVMTTLPGFELPKTLSYRELFPLLLTMPK